MQRIRLIGLCLVAAFVISAVATATASAGPPEYGRCVTQAGGKFKNGGCTVASKPGEEKFEWFPGPGAKKKFTSKLKPETFVTLETVSGIKVTCKGETNSGEYTGPKEIANLVIKLTGCESGGFPCMTEGAKAGEVVFKPLVALLAFAIKVGTKRQGTGVGRATFPLTGETVVEMTCGGVPILVKGTFLLFVPKNKMQMKSTLKYTATKGKQSPEEYENAAKENERGILEGSFGGGPFEQTGLTATVLQTNEQKIEVNTVV